jgi:O-antigen ligase
MRVSQAGEAEQARTGRPGILFFLFAATLIYGVYSMGVPISQGHMADRRYRDVFMVAVAVLSISGGVTWKAPLACSRQDRIILCSAIALPAYALCQIVPLPVGLIEVLSPARGELLRSLTPLFGPRAFAPLSIAPSATFTHVCLFASYVALLLAARGFAARAGERIWLVAAPLVLIGAIESVLGLVQFAAGENEPAKGTYGIRNHLAGLLEMVFPFAAMYGWGALRAVHDNRKRWLQCAVGFSFAGLLLAGLLCTLSRGGLAAFLVSFLALAAVGVGGRMTRKKRLITLASVIGIVLIALALFMPVSLVMRLAQHSSEGRYTVFREGLGVVREYPLFGCGLGGFESAFLKFKAAEGILAVDYAHNDYLQMLAELGVVGFLLEGLLVGSVLLRSLRHAESAAQSRWFAVACVGSLAAILTHSAFDFNLYVAANAAVLAWICGMAAGQTEPIAGPRPGVIEFESASPRRSMPFR